MSSMAIYYKVAEPMPETIHNSSKYHPKWMTTNYWRYKIIYSLQMFTTSSNKKYQIKPIIVAILSPDMGRLNLGNRPTWITHR